MWASWLLLVLSVVAVAFTVNAFRPIRRNRLLFVPSFFASAVTIELSALFLPVGLVLTGALVWAGALQHWAGWVGLVLAAVNWVAMVVMVLRSWGTAGVASEALAALTDEAPEAGRLAIRRRKDIPFRRVAGRVLRLDVFEPVDPPPPGERRPALLQIHGGAWVIGDKREQGIPLLKAMAKRGWVCFNANYRLSPGATWPDHLIDLKQALAFIREHADEYGVDPSFVAVTGGSAGGHLASMVALTPNDPRYQPGFEDADTSVQAAVPFYGVYDFTNRDGTMPDEFVQWFLQPMIVKAFLDEEPEKFASASPRDNLRGDAPPFLVIHGDYDTLAPVQDARRFVDELAAVSDNPVVYIELHGAQHAFDLVTTIRSRRVVRAVDKFLSTLWVRHQAGHEPDDAEAGEEGLPGPAEGADVVANG
ncbi:alpha/beta hydrolase [Rhabdothermincola salaria]|uniref:alpha/beta hydrolase n=1 Tax=Rhabdothermincola salaria TaxID=2903142 RepID=UPI001E2C6FA0|nr:alpha/beta hydrolase [Rhabdothermincola salaria]MCD9625029.1 alpha/beta hydrolase [Rhabdothermincola salaria]